MRLIKVGLVFLLLAGFKSVNGQTLTVGMPAPKLKVESWLKGTPVTQLDTGKIYVVEFWATWCMPCRAMIPRLTELQAKYKDKVTIIGVSVLEKNPDYVPVFVESMGDKMNYHVAKDDRSQADTPSGYMAINWLTAAGAPGIPWAFIIDKSGKIAFEGNSADIDAPLEKVLQNN